MKYSSQPFAHGGRLGWGVTTGGAAAAAAAAAARNRLGQDFYFNCERSVKSLISRREALSQVPKLRVGAGVAAATAAAAAARTRR